MNNEEFRYITNDKCKRLLQPLLLDGAYILSRNCKLLNNKKYKVEPFYTESEVYRMMNKTIGCELNKIYKLNEYVSYEFTPNNHIVGASSISLYIKSPSGNVKKIFYSGDIGSFNSKRPFVEETKIVNKSTIHIMEATYSDLSRGFNKNDIKKEREQMKRDILSEIKKKHSILCPCFAQNRTQEILAYLYDTFKDDETFDTPIYLDGKLSLEINSVYREILNEDDRKYFNDILSWDKLHFVKGFDDSVTLALNKDEVKIVLSSAGMCNVGRVLNHLKFNIENPNYAVMIVGYCAPNTIGGNLLNDKMKEVKIEGMDYKKRCKVIRYNCWSSHIQGEEIIKYLSQVNTNLVIFHHSDDNKYKFRDIVEQELRNKNKSTNIVCADSENNIFFI